MCWERETAAPGKAALQLKTWSGFASRKDPSLQAVVTFQSFECINPARPAPWEHGGWILLYYF